MRRHGPSHFGSGRHRSSRRARTPEEIEAQKRFNVNITKLCPASCDQRTILKYQRQPMTFDKSDYLNSQFQNKIGVQELDQILNELKAVPGFDSENDRESKCYAQMFCCLFVAAMIGFLTMVIGLIVFLPVGLVGLIIFLICFITALYIIFTSGSVEDAAYKRRETQMKEVLARRASGFQERGFIVDCGHEGSWLEIRVEGFVEKPKVDLQENNQEEGEKEMQNMNQNEQPVDPEKITIAHQLQQPAKFEKFAFE